MGKSLLACAWIAVLGLGYVWQKNQIYRLGDEMKKREAILLATQKRNTMLAAQLAHLKSPAQLESRSQFYSLGLAAPRENQVVRVYEPGPEWDMQAVRTVQTTPRRASSQTRVVAQR